ncbi:hypothetical protein [Nostoc sp. ChiQUE01b]|uniref:hypothetical protein n=1 Tax=Nostoc sp. ChiQUE01b TaxID=3075376 RepID=UPI002AD58436|nr:hypothetical protein [Nostoc sp. ChiQUE01b]MDZ8260691.1 hypothetical protein [Nostoc sp. ChiQUE01b]
MVDNQLFMIVHQKGILHWELGMGHWAWGIGHGAWGMGHWAWVILLVPSSPSSPHSPLPTPHSLQTR